MKSILVLAVMIGITTLTMAQKNKIIFVCEHGAAKSVIAASYFNKLAKERNLNYVAECRGTDPDSVVSQTAKDGLAKDNVLSATMKPQKLVAADSSNVARIILFTPLPASMSGSVKTENWSKIENLDAEYSKRRDAIVKKINELLDTLEKQK